MGDPAEPSILPRPASVIVIGDDRALLNWVALALATVSDPSFHWTDVRLQGEVVADSDPLARDVIARNRLSLARVSDLAPDNANANMAVSAVIRGNEPPETLQRLLDFLRLPARSQRALARTTPGARPRVFVLSNSHRLVGHYPTAMVGPLLRAAVATGVIVIMTFADAPTEGRYSFDVVLRLEGVDPKNWRDAKLRIEKGFDAGALKTGQEHRLVDMAPVAEILTRHLG